MEQPKRRIFAPNVMAIRDQRQDNKSKQKTSLAGFDVAPPIGVASRLRDLIFSLGNENIKKDTFINKNVNIGVIGSDVGKPVFILS